MHLLVMAKAPVAGRVKTRLCPPCEPRQAAAVARAALADTLDAVARCGADRRIIALDGDPGDWLPAGFEVIAQEGPTFSARLTAAWAHAGGPGLQIGMDTPQVTAELLDACLGRLVAPPDRRAALGLASDGGWWALGLSEPDPWIFAGVPMSTPATGAAQLARLGARGWPVDPLPELRDIDTAGDLAAVAAALPGSRTEVAARAAGIFR